MNGRPTANGGRRTALEYVEGELREQILSGELPGGTRLAQIGISERLGVSTTPVREALRQLAAEGLVEVDNHRGAVVRKSNLSDALEIFDLRRRLEPYAAELAVERAGEEDLASLWEYHKEMLEADSLSEWFTFNRLFHEAFIDAARSSRLQAVLRGLINSTAIYLGLALRTVLTPFEAGNDDHAQMIRALEARDTDELQRLVLSHLEKTLVVIREALALSEADPSGREVGSTSQPEARKERT